MQFKNFRAFVAIWMMLRLSFAAADLTSGPLVESTIQALKREGEAIAASKRTGEVVIPVGREEHSFVPFNEQRDVDDPVIRPVTKQRAFDEQHPQDRDSHIKEESKIRKVDKRYEEPHRSFWHEVQCYATLGILKKCRQRRQVEDEQQGERAIKVSGKLMKREEQYFEEL